MQDQGSGATGGRKVRQVTYLPGQVCIMCSAVGTDRLPTYKAVTGWLQGRIVKHLRNPTERWAGIDPRDLHPTNLLRAAARAAARNREITWLVDVQDAKRVGPRRVVLPPAGDDQNARALHFYRIGVPPSVRHNPANDDDPNVRELVNLINLGILSDARGGDTGSGWRVVAATPDWLASGADDGWTFPGPGARPEPVRPQDVPSSRGGRWRFRFENGELDELVERARSRSKNSSVTVAILDTSPRPGEVDR